jgi:hypothetical protein
VTDQGESAAKSEHLLDTYYRDGAWPSTVADQENVRHLVIEALVRLTGVAPDEGGRLMDRREEALAAIGREVRYRDALWRIREDVKRLEGLVTISGHAVVTRRVLATIDGALDIGGEFCGLPEPRLASDEHGRTPPEGRTT